MNEKIRIMPEYSAQGIKKQVSPLLSFAIQKSNELLNQNKIINNPLIVEHGCGLLRNTKELIKYYDKIILVDTEFQLKSLHNFEGNLLTIEQYVKTKWSRKNIIIMTNKEYINENNDVDIIYSINVLDVTHPMIRKEIYKSFIKTMNRNTLLVVILSRNDSWTLRLCKNTNKYFDGYVFKNRDAYTFYKNWNGNTLHKDLEKRGFKIINDFTNYKYVGLILSKK